MGGIIYVFLEGDQCLLVLCLQFFVEQSSECTLLVIIIIPLVETASPPRDYYDGQSSFFVFIATFATVTHYSTSSTCLHGASFFSDLNTMLSAVGMIGNRQKHQRTPSIKSPNLLLIVVLIFLLVTLCVMRSVNIFKHRGSSKSTLTKLPLLSKEGETSCQP